MVKPLQAKLPTPPTGAGTGAGMSPADLANMSVSRPDALKALQGTLYGAKAGTPTTGVDERPRNYQRSPRPTDDANMVAKLADANLLRVLTGQHECTNVVFSTTKARFTNCNCELFGDDFGAALQLLTKHYTDFFNLGSKSRSAKVYCALAFTPGNAAKFSMTNCPRRGMIEYLVPEANPLLPPRRVCRETFLQYWPISKSTLKRVRRRQQ